MNKPIRWTHAQKKAMDSIVRLIKVKGNRIVVLTGHGATGKTFMVNELDKKYNTEKDKMF